MKKNYTILVLLLTALCTLPISCRKKSNEDDRSEQNKREDTAGNNNIITENISQDAADSTLKLGELSCIERESYLTGCTMNDKQLAEKQTNLSEFSLKYSFGCIGHDLAIAIVFEDIEIPLKPKDSGEVVLRGYGPLVIKDLDPEWSRSARLQKEGCSLDIEDFTIEQI